MHATVSLDSGMVVPPFVDLFLDRQTMLAPHQEDYALSVEELYEHYTVFLRALSVTDDTVRASEFCHFDRYGTILPIKHFHRYFIDFPICFKFDLLFNLL